MSNRRAGVAWMAGLVVVLTAMVGTVGVNAAQADGPTPSPSPEAPATASAQARETTGASPLATDTPTPSAQAREATGASPMDTDTATSTPSPTPVRCPKCPPDTYVPPSKTWFNHPFEKSSAGDIRQMVRRTVNSVPSGGTIKLAEFSLNDNRLVDALIAAWKRGVTVQVVVNNHNVTGSIERLGKSKSFIRLSKRIGTERYGHGNIEHVSFARYCHASCRGHGGNVHYKLFLFSSVGRTNYDPSTGVELPVCPAGTTNSAALPCTTKQLGRNVTMMGSPNLTTKAAYGQWNHLDTYNNQKTYDYYLTWFAQMRADKALRHPYERKTTGAVNSWTFPKPGTTARNDPLMQGLNGVRCKGAKGGSGARGRTKIRIGAYTFYDGRGRYLAKKVRSLWNAGCDVAIEYAIMGDTVKRILYSPAGRGRIPMRQVVTFYRNGDLDAYDHAKYIAISGNYGRDSSTWITYTGTTNISDLGFRSDDTQQVWRSRSRTTAYFKDWSHIWRSRYARVPSPTSRLGARIGSPQLTLGKGRYASLEPS